MFRIDGVIQNYAWGSTDGIARVLGTQPGTEPQAELWLGAHPKAPSTRGEQTLDALIAADPAMLGADSRAAFGNRLPFLMKVLSATRALSLQAHPSRAQAEAGYAAEDAAGLDRAAGTRNYRDDWPKPEAMVALTEFHGLCGFRDPARTRELAGRLGVAALDEILAPLTEADGLKTVFLNILALGPAAAPIIDEVVAAARPHADSADGGDEFTLLCRTAVEVAADYPGDPGVLAALLLNRVVLQPGEAFSMPAGNMHAYLHGTGIEIMAASDNVLRGGLTAKHIDVAELAEVVDFTPGLPAPAIAETVTEGVSRFTIDVPEFALHIVTGDDRQLPATGSARILLAVDGPAELASARTRIDLPQGGAVFVPADEAVCASTAGRLFVASCGL